MKADLDTFIFVDNLKKFLKTKNSSHSVSYGYELKIENGYHSGGAGYVLSREAFNRIGAALSKNYSFCPNSGIEDIDCGSCLNSLGVEKDNSTDIFGKEKFFPQNIIDFVNGKNFKYK